jgi:CysZ protein
MSIAQQLLLGWRTLLTGFRVLLRNPSLWPWAVFPFVIQCAVFLTVIGLFASHFDLLYSTATGFLQGMTIATEGVWGTLLSWGWLLVEIVLKMVFFLLAVSGIVMGTFLLGLLIAGPFNELLSERVEALTHDRQDPPLTWRGFVRGLRRSIVVELQKTALFLGAPLCFFLLYLVPVAGGIVALILTALFETWATGFTFVDYPFGRRNTTFRARIAFARRHAAALMAFGVIFWVPGALILCGPPLVVGGTVLFGRLQEAA